MPLSVGERLGPYEILAPVGAGGMGEVYQANDTRLGRTVAIKVSKTEFSERFELEARAVAALNHPNICHLYDVGPNYLVMEYIEGAPLKGPLPVDQALKYAAQICGALDAAHKKGITHRDLKPANILATKAGIKLLDFGLAKLASSGIGQAAKSPDEVTLTTALTGRNEIVGTLYYMSPEQLQGQAPGNEIDARSDIFSFGLVLYELLTGKRAFEGSTPASVIAAILERPAPSIADVAPPALDRVLNRCLAKDPDNRWQSARDLKAALEWIAAPLPEDISPPKTVRRRWLIPGLIAVALLAAATGFWLRQPPPERPFKFSITPPEGTAFVHVSRGGAPAISPDGLRIAVVTEGSTGRLLSVQSLDGFSARSLAGTDQATSPFWSPDGRWIGFFAQENLKKVDPESGEVQIVASVVPSANLSGSWNVDNGILYYGNDTKAGNALKLVSASGGQPVVATSRNNELLDENHYFPFFLPDGRHYLLEVRGGPELDTSIWLGTLGSNVRSLLLKDTSNAQYAPPRLGAPGYIVFARDRNLMAQAFDVAQGTLSGPVFVVAGNVAITSVGTRADFTVSPMGLLAYRTVAEPAPHEMIWYDRSGKVVGTIGDRPGHAWNGIRISPDGKAIAFTRRTGETQEVWIHDLVRAVSSRLTLNGGRSPVWSPDNSQIAFVRGDTIYRMPVTGGLETVVWRGPRLIAVNDWSGDGKFLLFTRWDEQGVRQTWLLPDPMGGGAGKEPVALANGIHSEFAPAIGAPRWVSYDRDQISVRGMPGDDSGPWQVSTDGGNGTRFRRDGREMYFTSGQSFMAVDLEVGPTFRHGPPHPLFPVPRGIQAGQGQYAQGYDVTADGSKFLATFPAPDTPAASMTVLRNWQATLRK